MKTYKCEILADSKNQFGNRITTFLLTYPRIIHSELMTHRMFSRNSASSRAIPFEKMVKMVEEDPFIPTAWQKEHKGMQGTGYITDEKLIRHKNKIWLSACKDAIKNAKWLNSNYTNSNGKSIECKVTKQLCNRLLEPFMWHTTLVTGTEFENFFELRCPKYQTPVSRTIEPQRSWKDLLDNHSNPINEQLIEVNKDNWVFKMQHNLSQADIHIQAIAELMWDAYNESVPKELKAGEWHIPFGHRVLSQNDSKTETFKEGCIDFSSSDDIIITEIKIAVARAARLSYTNHLGDINYEKDIQLHDRLLKDKHMSPFEHCARAMDKNEEHLFRKVYPVENMQKVYIDGGWCDNFKGFISYRYLLTN